MSNRKGEKIGWIGGWMGSFCWVFILMIVFFAQGKTRIGIHGILICLIAVLLMLAIAPWRYPSTPYWKLLLPLYLLLTAAVVWAVKGFGEQLLSALNWWSLLPMLSIFLPLFLLWSKRWRDG